MERQDVIRWAGEAGLRLGYSFAWPDLESFAIEVAAAAREEEREACAVLAEAYEPRCDTCPSGVANAIRAKSNIMINQDDLILIKPGGVVPVNMETTGKLVRLVQRLSEENERLKKKIKPGCLNCAEAVCDECGPPR